MAAGAVSGVRVAQTVGRGIEVVMRILSAVECPQLRDR